MIDNYMCDKCEHLSVCKKADILDKFNEDSKKYIGIDITMESCINFNSIEVIEPVSTK